MTIGRLAKQTGVSIKALREYEGLGLIYTLGRSEGNYRLFDETALWCVRQIEHARSLGLTLKEIREVCAAYQRGGDSFAALLREKLARSLARADARLAELQALRARIVDFDGRLSQALARSAEHEFLEPDPRRQAGARRVARLSLRGEALASSPTPGRW